MPITTSCSGSRRYRLVTRENPYLTELPDGPGLLIWIGSTQVALGMRGAAPTDGPVFQVGENHGRAPDGTTITVAVTTALTSVVNVAHFLGIPDRLVLHANFNYGSGGTTVHAYVQTSLDGGTTWTDIANSHFTTASAVKYSNRSHDGPMLAAVALTDVPR